MKPARFLAWTRNQIFVMAARREIVGGGEQGNQREIMEEGSREIKSRQPGGVGSNWKGRIAVLSFLSTPGELR